MKLKKKQRTWKINKEHRKKHRTGKRDEEPGKKIGNLEKQQ